MKRIRSGSCFRILITLVVLSLSLGYVFPTPVAATVAWTQMESGTEVALHDIRVCAEDAVYAVGDNHTLLFYDGNAENQWVQLNPGTFDADFRGVWGDSPDNVFVVGTNGIILHYAGADTWESMDVSTEFLTPNFTAVWGFSQNDVYAAGYSESPFGFSYIVHYDGSEWTTSFVDISNNYALSDIWGSDVEHLFAAGGGAPGEILKFNGSGWDSTFVPDCSYPFHRIAGSSNDYIVAAGEMGEMAIWNGVGWTRLESSFGICNGIWVSPDDTEFKVYDNGYIQGPDGTVQPVETILNAIDGNSSINVYAAGDGGVILHYTETEPPAPTPESNSVVSCTVSVQTVAITVEDGSIQYGKLALGTSEDTIHLQQTQLVRNTGGVPAEIKGKCSDATGGNTWELVNPADIGLNRFAHQWSSDTGSNWEEFDPGNNYGATTFTLANNETRPFDLRIFMPTSVTDTSQKTITITLLATAVEETEPPSITDTDNDGVPDYIEIPYGNTDGDAFPNYLDTDDDNDGILTAEEGVEFTEPDFFTTRDTDGDSIPDYLDDDDDGDGYITLVESKEDGDGDDIPGYLDPDEVPQGYDTDLDGVPDYVELSTENLDTDEDGLLNYLDNDDDGDGILTINEGVYFTAPDIFWAQDTDFDDEPDYLDTDDDGDGTPTALEGTQDGDQDGYPEYLDIDDADEHIH